VGSVVAFVVIELYFYYSKLTQTISQTSTQIDQATLVYYAIPIFLAAVAAVLLLGLWNIIVPRGSPHTSQTLMRWRIVLQFIALFVVMAALYL
jgi:Hypoxia induced protein conserved region